MSYNAQRNESAERMNSTKLSMAKSMLVHSGCLLRSQRELFLALPTLKTVQASGSSDGYA